MSGPGALASEAERAERAEREAELLLRQGEALAKLGRVRDALVAYGRVARLGVAGMAGMAGPQLPPPLPADRLRPLAVALLDEVAAPHLFAADNRPASSPVSLVCPACESVLQAPVTLACGHTACRNCLSPHGHGRPTCPRCSHRPAPGTPLVTNVLVQRLVERWWPRELRAAQLRDQGNALFHDGKLHEAIHAYDEAVQFSPSSALLRSNRSHALCCLGRHLLALQDADEAVRLRPAWGKGHYRRGAALLALGRFEEALSAFCACAVLGRSPQCAQGVRAEVTRALHRLLAAVSLSASGRSVSRTPGPRLAWRAPPSCSSDCEDNSSDEGEEDRRGRGPCGELRLLAVLDHLLQDMDKLRKFSGGFPCGFPCEDLAVSPGLVDQSELDCVLCCRTLWKPVTTPCGHTYCCMCLDRCLDHSYSCPLCMTSLTEYLTTSPRNVTEWLETALQRTVPRELALRQASHALELSEHGPLPVSLPVSPAHSHCVPVFVCTSAFPGVPCPLYVFEPRYRLLARRCIESGSRTFGMAAPACVHRGGPGQDRFVEFGTLLEICDLVRLCDGSSILSTVGRRRFRVLQRGERDGYDVAGVQLYSDEPTTAERLPGVRELHDRVRMKSELWLRSMDPEPRTEIERSFGAMPAVEPGWETCPDGPLWAWYLLAVLPLGPQLQVGILRTTSLEKRLRAIDKTLDHLAHRLRSQRQSASSFSPSTGSPSSPSTTASCPQPQPLSLTPS